MGRTAERINRCSKGSVFVRCGCRDESGLQLGKSCPKRGIPRHGSWTFEVRVGPAGSRRRVRAADMTAPDGLVVNWLPTGAETHRGAWPVHGRRVPG